MVGSRLPTARCWGSCWSFPRVFPCFIAGMSRASITDQTSQSLVSSCKGQIYSLKGVSFLFFPLMRVIFVLLLPCFCSWWAHQVLYAWPWLHDAWSCSWPAAQCQLHRRQGRHWGYCEVICNILCYFSSWLWLFIPQSLSQKLIRLTLTPNSLLSTQTTVASPLIQAEVFSCGSGEHPALDCKSANQIHCPAQLCVFMDVLKLIFLSWGSRESWAQSQWTGDIKSIQAALANMTVIKPSSVLCSVHCTSSSSNSPFPGNKSLVSGNEGAGEH